MNWKWLSWIFPLVVAIAVYVGYSLFPVTAFTPEMSKEVAVVVGVRPAADVFPGLWRYAAGMLPANAAAYGAVGRIFAALFGLFLYFSLNRAMRILHRVTDNTGVLEGLFIPTIAMVCALMGAFAEPVWRAFSLFAPASLVLLYVVVATHLFLDWIAKGAAWRLWCGLVLMGIFSAETPFAVLIPVGCYFGYILLWGSIHNNAFRPRSDLPMLFLLPMWRMTIAFAAGIAIGCFANILRISSDNILETFGWNFSYVFFHYCGQYIKQIGAASAPAGWVLGIPLCVIPLVLNWKLLPTLTDDDRPMPFILGLVAMFCTFIAFFEQGPLRGAWFWTWVGERELVYSDVLLCMYSVSATCAFAFGALIFIADAFNAKRAENRGRYVVLSYRVAMVVLTFLVALQLGVRLPHTNVRKILAFNESAVKETYRELNGAKFVFTDGSADAELELEAYHDGRKLYAISLLGESSVNSEALRLRGLTDDGDISAAKMGPSALLRTWACDKKNGLDESALQLGFELWKRELRLTPPKASAFVARTKGMRPEDIRDATAISEAFGNRIVELTDTANSPDVPASVREMFFTLSWRLSRFARYRKDSELSERLESVNSALKKMLEELEYARVQVFLQMTPKEGLELALKRADFVSASRYASAVLKIDEEDPCANFAMGMYCLMANRLEDAEGYLRDVLIRRPNEPAVINNLSIICRKTGRYEEALELAKLAFKMLPENEDIKQTLKDAEARAP